MSKKGHLLQPHVGKMYCTTLNARCCDFQQGSCLTNWALLRDSTFIAGSVMYSYGDCCTTGRSFGSIVYANCAPNNMPRVNITSMWIYTEFVTVLFYKRRLNRYISAFLRLSLATELFYMNIWVVFANMFLEQFLPPLHSRCKTFAFHVLIMNAVLGCNGENTYKAQTLCSYILILRQ